MSVRMALRKSFAAVQCPHDVLVGLSGGADSVALLLSLCELRGQGVLKLHAVHVNHNLRENAADDEAFCRNLCKNLDVPLTVKRVNVPRTGSLEAAARQARYTAFAEAMRSCGAKVLALAHHADDQAETMVMHLLYGAGTTGLCGMREMSGSVWRPFLTLRRNQLREYLAAFGQAWREDESNQDAAFTRNRIRAQVMPVLEACGNACVESMGRTAVILQNEDDYLNGIADEWLAMYASASSFPFIMAEELKALHAAVQRRVIRRYALKLGITLDYASTELVRGILEAENGTIDNLPENWRVMKCAKRLHFLPPEGSAHEQESPKGELLVISGEAPKDAAYYHQVPKEQAHDLYLRTRRSGDFIQPFGMHGTKSLKEYMIDIGLDRPLRNAWPLVCRGSEVLWVIGLGASEKLRVVSSEQDAMKLIFTGNLPDEYRGKKNE